MPPVAISDQPALKYLLCPTGTYRIQASTRGRSCEHPCRAPWQGWSASGRGQTAGCAGMLLPLMPPRCPTARTMLQMGGRVLEHLNPALQGERLADDLHSPLVTSSPAIQERTRRALRGRAAGTEHAGAHGEPAQGNARCRTPQSSAARQGHPCDSRGNFSWKWPRGADTVRAGRGGDGCFSERGSDRCGDGGGKTLLGAGDCKGEEAPFV